MPLTYRFDFLGSNLARTSEDSTLWSYDQQSTFGAGLELTLSSQTEVRELFRMAHLRGLEPRD
jgi:hypothetical protein